MKLYYEYDQILLLSDLNLIQLDDLLREYKKQHMPSRFETPKDSLEDTIVSAFIDITVDIFTYYTNTVIEVQGAEAINAEPGGVRMLSRSV